MSQSRQKCYKRVTISCHITYLTLSNADERENTEDQLDRARIFPFHHRKTPAGSGEIFLFKASSSVLLTLCTPEESKSCEEEVRLLRTPRALWTVLAINSSAEFASDHQTKQYLTPIAQYVRGITSSLHMQRTNAETIYGDMRKWLKDFQSESIFDDEQFTKSTSYHWAVRTCDELSESIASTLRFIRMRAVNAVDKLCREAHAYEKRGIDHWLERMKEEIFALKDLHAQILALRVQVQESVGHPLSKLPRELEVLIVFSAERRKSPFIMLAWPFTNTSIVAWSYINPGSPDSIATRRTYENFSIPCNDIFTADSHLSMFRSSPLHLPS
jgi:hypothetical protein